jgi:hypothetical protein
MRNGRCRTHGGKAGRPIVHGFYAKELQARRKERFLAAGNLVNAYDISAELAVARSLLGEYLGGLGETLTVENLDPLVKLIDSVSKIIDRAIRARNQTAFTVAEVRVIAAGMEHIIDRYVQPNERGAFLADLRRIVPDLAGRNL